MFKYLKLFLIAASIVTIAASSIPFPQEGEKFENLKVLPKDITDEQLDSVMDHFKTSLDVKCSFCHAGGPVIDGKKHLDFVSDAKPEKLRAREMIQMTNYLNETFFNPDHSSRPDTIHEVICYTCHRGTKEPEAEMLFLEVDSIMRIQHQRK
ncbi:MAG: c-type cytochrome [Bacteroidetes bacterium]|nr:c-type cytochrome [Bacteroidota bacterium]